MEMPQPTEKHRALERLAGHWVGEETMHPSMWVCEGGTATGVNRSRVDLGGFAVIGEYHQEKEGQTTFTGHGVYTFDPAADEIVLYWFDCMGTQPDLFRGNFEGDVLTLISDESGEGGPRFSRMTYDFSEEGLLRSRMEMSQDGAQWNVMMDAAYRRVD